jgi:hypothetical protein
LGHLLTPYVLTHPEISSVVFPAFFSFSPLSICVQQQRQTSRVCTRVDYRRRSDILSVCVCCHTVAGSWSESNLRSLLEPLKRDIHEVPRRESQGSLGWMIEHAERPRRWESSGPLFSRANAEMEWSRILRESRA